MLPTRFWELSSGTLVAFAIREVSGRRRTFIYNALILLGIALILRAISLSVSVSWFSSVFVVLGSSLLIWSNWSFTFLSKVFAGQPLNFVGRISYSLYLFHWPVFVFGGFWFDLTNTNKSLLLTVTFILSIISYYLIELPFRRQQFTLYWRSIEKALGPVIALIISISGFWIMFDGGGRLYDIGYDDEILPTWRNTTQVRNNDLFDVGKKTARPQFLIIGDSHSNSLSHAYVELANIYNVYGWMASSDGTTLAQRYQYDKPWNRYYQKTEFISSIIELVKEQQITNIIVNCAWTQYIDNSSKLKFYYDDTPVKSNNFQIFKQDFLSTIHQLIDLGCHIYIIEQFPIFDFDLQKLIFSKKLSIDKIPLKLNLYKRFKDIVLNINSQHVTYISTINYFKKDGKFILSNDNKILYRNAGHLSKYGALFILDALIPIFEPIANKKIDHVYLR